VLAAVRAVAADRVLGTDRVSEAESAIRAGIEDAREV